MLERGVARKGWTVEAVEAYRVVDGPGIGDHEAATLAAGGYDAVILTSGSVAERYAPLAAPADARTLVIAIGRTTAAAAAAAHIRVDAVASTPSYAGIEAALENAWSARENS